MEAYNQPALAAGHVVYRGGYELHRPVRVGGQNHSNSPHRHLQATSADLGRFFVGGGVFWGRAFGPNGPIRRAGPIGAIPRVLITDGPSRYGSIDTSLLYPRLGVPSFFTHSTQMIDLGPGHTWKYLAVQQAVFDIIRNLCTEVPYNIKYSLLYS